MESQRQGGFTIIELTLSTAFLGFLLVFVVTVVIQMMFVYNKGLSIRSINQSGRQLGDDMSRTLKFAESDDIVYSQAGQRLCANEVAYIWNYPGTNVNKYVDNSPIPGMVRVSQDADSYCSTITKPVPVADATSVTGSRVEVLEVNVEVDAYGSGGRLTNIDMVLATAGEANRPTLVSPGVYTCPTGYDGAFCAFGNFNTTAYSRN